MPKSQGRLISKALRAQLPSRAPDEIALQLSLRPGASWAMCVSAALLHAAVRGDVAAAKEIRECTEGTRSRIELDPDGQTMPLLNVVFVSAKFKQLSDGTFIERSEEELEFARAQEALSNGEPLGPPAL